MSAPFVVGDTVTVRHTCVDHGPRDGDFAVERVKEIDPDAGRRWRISATRATAAPWT